jgi:hypothetical protein
VNNIHSTIKKRPRKKDTKQSVARYCMITVKPL